METKIQAANFTRSYEDFQPAFNWVREEGLDTLVLHLPGFKKEQLRVQVDSHGNMKISGERPLEEKIRWSRFRKDFPIPKNCDVNEIHAKFIGGLLYVKLPKKSIQVIAQDQPTLPQEAPVGQKISDEKKPDKEQVTGNVNNMGRINGSNSENYGGGSSGEGAGVCSLAMHKKPVRDGLFSRLKKHRRLVLGVAVVATAVVALGVYVACRLTSPALGEKDGN